jgi:hypothetical protein
MARRSKCRFSLVSGRPGGEERFCLCPRSHTPNAITTASAKANQAVAYCLAPSSFQIRQSQVWVRDPAARYARVVCERFAPKEIRGRGECRVPVAPAASRAVKKGTRVSHHRFTGTPGIPARNGFNGFLRALPGDRAWLSPSSRGYGWPDPVGPTSPPRDLTPASRRQDHTTSPSAASISRQLLIAHGPKPALRSPRAQNAAASTASRPASVTIAIRPSVGTRRREF